MTFPERSTRRRAFRHASRVILATLLMAGFARASRANDEPLVGPVVRADLKKPPYADWFAGQYSGYRPADAQVAKLRDALSGVSIEAYFGTWCGDSRRQVPRLIRLLDLAGFDERRLTLIGLSDRAMEFKHSPGRPEDKRQVHRTPTIVVLRDGSEIGRIVETPAASLEEDLRGILAGTGPTPKYGAEAWVHHLFVDLPPGEAEIVLKTADAEVAKRGDSDSLWHYAEHDLMKNGRPSEALAVLNLHLRLNPKSVAGHVLTAEALLALGRRTEAQEAIERALAIDPTSDRARRTAEKIRRP